MRTSAAYSLATANSNGAGQRHVIVDRDLRLHVATSWLTYLADVGRSPNTTKQYGRRVAAYLSWTAQTQDWRAATVSHLALWRNVVASTPTQRSNVPGGMRAEQTVALWMTPLRSFYEWADNEGLLTTDMAKRMTQLKYFAAGTAAGGEHGKSRRVLAEGLRPARSAFHPSPKWIDSSAARFRLEGLPLNARDRLLIDLLYYTGIRAGEALSLFRRDIHFARNSLDFGCNLADPHFHVRVNNEVENGARSKGQARTLYVSDEIVEEYIDYMIERQRALGAKDLSPHVFVNLYTHSRFRGRAMSYNGVLSLVKNCGTQIATELSGPHMLRHTFATRLVRGIDCDPQPLDVVQSLLGHASILSTRVYTHDLEAAKKAALMSLPPRKTNLEQPGD